MTKCECGCGQEATINKRTKKPNKYIHGHNGRNLPLQGPLPLCACGCGKVVAMSRFNGLSNQFFNGHNRRGKTSYNLGMPCREETKVKLRNANIGKHHSVQTKQKMSESQSGEKHSMFGKQRPEETKQKISDSTIGKKHWNWLGGISNEGYGPEFNEQLKENIRGRDRHRCQECFRHQDELTTKLSVHHIDFNKKNNDHKNLISLCNSCHGQTNYSREDWTKYFNNRLV